MNVADPALFSAADSVRCTSLTSADLSRDDLTGLSLGPYVLGRRIGCGGMGQVFEAQHLALGKKFAIKLMLADVAMNSEAERRFRDEVASVGKLQHPNVLNAVDAGCSCGVHFLVTDFINGMNLLQLVATNGPLAVDKACDIICQAARGLSHAHSLGFIHRDIKPSNIVIDSHGVVRLLDFGLVRNSERQDGITSAGQLLGTIDFLAPEQAADGRIADHRSDLYSLGCTLLFLLSGKPPFFGEQFVSLTSKIHGHLFLQPAGLQNSELNLPPHVRSCLESMLAKQPSDRPVNADDVVRHLEAKSDDVARGSVQASASSPAPSCVVSTRTGLAWLLIAGTLAGGVISAITILGPQTTTAASIATSAQPARQLASESAASKSPSPGSTPIEPSNAAASNVSASETAAEQASNSETSTEIDDPTTDSGASRTVEVKKSLSSWNVGIGRKKKSTTANTQTSESSQHRTSKHITTKGQP